MLGILCEKPSAARNFAKALGGMSGNFNGTDYVIATSRGHLYGYDQPVNQVSGEIKEKYEKWDLNNLPWNENDFEWKRVKKKDVNDVLKNIKVTLSGCDEIAIATDVDPSGEGELLAWEILDELKLKPLKWSRFYFTDEAVNSIQKAFKTRKPIISMIEDNDYRKAVYRTKWDFMSMQFTRIATCLTGVKLRQGRLKSAMALMVGDGLKAVAEYKRIPFYQWRFIDENGNVFSSENEPQYKTKEELIKKYNNSEVVIDKTEQKNTAPPKLLDLSALSARLSSKGIKAEQVLSVYQKMYEDQVVSYPRTEDKLITPEQFDELLPLIDKIANVVGVNTALLTHREKRKTHVKVGGAHGANRPGINVPDSLSDLSKYGSCAKDIYEILAKNFLAMFGEDYIYTHQTGHLKEYPDFKGYANAPVSLGYKAIYSDDDNNDDDEEKKSEKLLGKSAVPFEYEGFPKKPPVPTVKWLMSQLEKRDIGTGSTRTSTYADVSNDKSKDSLLKENKGKITLTEAGDMSYMLLPGTHIGSLEITEEVFNEMKGIADKTLNERDCLSKIQLYVLEDIETMKKNLPNVLAKYPNAAQRNVTFEKKESVEGLYKPVNAKVSFSRVWSGYRFTDEEVIDLLNGKEIIIAVKSKNGNPYNVTGRLAEQEYKGKKYFGFSKIKAEPANIEDYAVGIFTPENKEIRFKKIWAGHIFSNEEIVSLLNGDTISFELNDGAITGSLKEQVYNGNKFWGFTKNETKDPNKVYGVYKKKNISFKREWSGHTFTDSEVEALLAGKEISFEAISKAGKPYTAKGKLKQQTYNGNKYWGFSLNLNKN